MKKTYFIPRRAAKISSKFARNAAYLTDGEKAEQEALLAKIKANVDEQLKTRASKDEADAITSSFEEFKKGMPLDALRAMADEKTGINAKMVELGLQVAALKAAAKEEGVDLSVRAQVKKWMEENKVAIASLKGGTKADLTPLSVRAANSPMLPANVMTGGSMNVTRMEREAGIVDQLRNRTWFWDLLRKGSTNAETYIWINKKNLQGSAAFIAPGIYKPGVSFEVVPEVSNAKKVAVNMKMAIELLQDIDGFASWVEDELYTNLIEHTNLVLMTATGSSTSPAGVQSLSVPYGLTGISVTNPNYYDAIKACVTQLITAKFRGGILAFMNPIDYANMVMSKAINQGQLFVPPALGCTIIEDNNMQQGYLNVVAMDYYRILIYKGFTMSYGWENQDFTKNLVTVIGEMRLHQFHSENHDGFAIFDTLENIVDAIRAPEPPVVP